MHKIVLKLNNEKQNSLYILLKDLIYRLVKILGNEEADTIAKRPEPIDISPTVAKEQFWANQKSLQH